MNKKCRRRVLGSWPSAMSVLLVGCASLSVHAGTAELPVLSAGGPAAGGLGGCSATLRVGDGQGPPGTTQNRIPVLLTANQPIRGLQLEVVDLPEALTATDCSSRHEDFDCFLDEDDLGTTHLIFVSKSGATIESATDLEIFELQYMVNPGAAIGNVMLQPQNLLVSDAGNQTCESTGLPGQFNVGGNLGGVPDPGENEEEMANALDEACATATGALAATCVILQSLSNSDALVALDAITAEEVAAQGGSLVEVTSTQINNVRTRLAALRGTGGGGVAFNGFSLGIGGESVPVGAIANAMMSDAEDRGDGSGLFEDARFGLFVNGRLDFGEKDATSNETGYDFGTGGITVGLDYRVTPEFVIGGALGYAKTSSDFARSGGELDAGLLSVSFYGNHFTSPRTYVDWIVGYGASEFETTRNIVFPGLSTVVTGDTDGSELSASVSGGLGFGKNGWSFNPYARVDFLDATIDAYTEENTAGLALSIGEQSIDSLSTAAAVNVNKTFSRGWGILTPGIRVEFEHEFKDDDRILLSSLAASPGTQFTVMTDAPDRNFFNIGVNLAALFRRGMSAFIDYEQVVGLDNVTRHTVNIGFRMEL